VVNYQGTSGHEGNKSPNTSTRFGGENAPVHSSEVRRKNAKPGSIRHSIRHFAEVKLTPEEILDMQENQLVLVILGKPRATPAEIGAARQLCRYLKDCASAEFLSDQIDGKLPNTNYNRDFSVIADMTEEQLNEFIKNNADAGAEQSHEAADCGGDNGEAEAGSDSGNASVEKTGEAETGSVASVPVPLPDAH